MHTGPSHNPSKTSDIYRARIIIYSGNLRVAILPRQVSKVVSCLISTTSILFCISYLPFTECLRGTKKPMDRSNCPLKFRFVKETIAESSVPVEAKVE